MNDKVAAAVELTQESLKKLLNYNPETGDFTWVVSIGAAKAGRSAGHLNKKGYVQIKIHKKHYSAHRLAWLYMYGEWPKNMIDHINHAKSDNRISNLRDVSATINTQNKIKALSTNKTGFLGVIKVGNRYSAKIRRSNAPLLELGSYETPEEAHAAYVSAKRKYHEGCTL